MLPPPRIYGILARKAPVAVLIRRGPTRQFRLHRWNLETDEVEDGQWFKGRIYEKRGDLSPDGRLFVYYAAKHKPVKGDWNKATWTAVSRPPYWTALAIWFKGDSWNGGGLFRTNEHLDLNGFGPRDGQGHSGKVPLLLSTLGLGGGEDNPIEEARFARDGWRTLQEMEVIRPGLRPSKAVDQALGALDVRSLVEAWEHPELKAWMAEIGQGFRTVRPWVREKAVRGHTLVMEDRIHGYRSIRKYALRSRPGYDMVDVEWADWDRRERLVFARKGIVYAWDMVEDPEPKAIVDLNGQSFKEVPPPDWAMNWERRV